MTNVFSLQKVFEGKILQVPNYQRGYAWEKRHWDELLEDLEFLAPGKDHYTGNLVLHKQAESVTDAGGRRNEVYHVVDGQQRLTTIVMLLDALRASLTASKPNLAAGVLASYIRFPDENGQDAYKLRLNTDCHDYFTHNVLGDAFGPQGPAIASHKRLRDARKDLGDFLQKKKDSLGEAFPAWLKEFHDKVTQRLVVGHFLVGDSTEVGVIFEVMNNRGKPLSELEKVKNYLLYVASKLHVGKHDLDKQIEDAWADIFHRLMSAGLTAADYEDRLLRAHWLMGYDPVAGNWDGSKSIKKYFHLRIDPVEHKKLLGGIAGYIRSLRDTVLAFSEVFSPRQNDAFAAYPEDRRPDQREWGSKLLRAGVISPFLPALLAVRLRFPRDADAYLSMLRLFELYAFRVYRWAGRRANAGQTRLFRIAYDLYHEQMPIDAAAIEVRAKALFYCPDQTFSDGFNAAPDNNFYYWAGLRYLLYEYELELARGRGVKLRWEDLEQSDAQRTIEHILPQTPNDPYWTERFSQDERVAPASMRSREKPLPRDGFRRGGVRSAGA